MGRFVIVEFIVFFAPIILFLLFVRIFHGKKMIEALNPRILTVLIGLGIVGTALGAAYLSSLDSKNLDGVYVPAKIVNGVVEEQARIEPAK